MNFGKLREVFVHNIPRNKNLFQFLHRYHGFVAMSKIPLPQENWMHLWSDLGKIKLSPSMVGQMTCMMSQMITRQKDLSNELSWAIWSWGRPSKVDCNSTLPWGSLILLILTSVGRFGFWQGKWTPNWKIPLGLEIRLKYISNTLSHAEFGHQEGC